MKDTKAILKGAREAIKNKNYEACMKLCKNVLREERDNYMALVFLGVSSQELGQLPKALDAFQNAVKANPANSLGWNGLINYYEKVNTKETKHELIKAYIGLLNTETVEKKLIECAQKLCNLCEVEEVPDVAVAIDALIKTQKCVNVTELATSLVEVLSKDEKLSPDLTLIYEEALRVLIGDQKTVCVKYYADYLNLLYKSKRRDELFSSAKKMHDIFQSDSISLKWICKMFNEIYVELNKTSDKEEVMTNYSDELLNVEAQSATAIFTKSILLIEQKRVLEGKELLDQVVNLLPGLQHAWVLLLRCCVKLNLFSEAIQAANKIDKFLQSDPKQKLKGLVEVHMIEALSRSDETDDLKKALQLYEMIQEDLKPACLCHMIRANINLGNFTQVESQLDDGCDEVSRKLLRSQLLAKQNKHQEALALLEGESVELSEWWLQIGLLYWELKQYDKSLVPYLKATKLDSSNHRCFLLLGNYYKHVNDLDKARRCYEKSFKLNTRSSEAGIELSKIYRKLKNWDANFLLLQALTGGVINKKNSWAWMQLGLQHLEQQDYDKAIANLRFVIRIEDTNMNCWESLADAYLAKGAYTSALKCYERVSSMCEETLYPLLQTATIKQILGEYTEAKTVFAQILKSNNSYVPALKGMAETCLLLARECFREQRLGTARDHAQVSTDHLTTALRQNSDLGCLWKLLGDSCFFVAALPEKYCFLSLNHSFLEGDEKGVQTSKRDDLFSLAEKCYYRSTGCLEDNVLIWHDLAVCYLSHSLMTKNKEICGQLIDKAQWIAQHCTSNNPAYWQHWNLLGNIAMNLDPPNYCLAQHSFIKAVVADNNSAVSWCNLGTLYFMLDDYKLANEAYSQAQRADPNYVHSWIGQALLAESLAHEDAMDLFRHSTQLGFHKQGALGYAYWVCRTLKKSPLDAVIYSIHNMHAIPVACDAMTWYTEHNPSEPSAWNMLGIFRERLGLKTGALQAYKNSLNLSKKDSLDLVRVNYGRALAHLNKYIQAVEVLAKVEAATFNSSSSLALALFRDKRYKESYDVYQQTLHWLSEDSQHQSDLLTALASMAYMFEGPNAAKTLLFQSIKLADPSPWSFYATLALGLLHNDLNLAQLVLKELQAFKDRKDCVQHLALLSTYFHLLKEKGPTSIREVSKIIHKNPDQAQIWLILSSLLIQSKSKSKAAGKCAQIAMKLGQNSMEVRKVLPLVALSLFAIGDTQEALWMAQKAVHSFPDSGDAWAVLLAVLLTTSKLPSTGVRNVFSFTKELCDNDELSSWLQRMSC